MRRDWREHSEAFDEYRAAAHWYEDRREGLGDAFMDAAIESILDPAVEWGLYRGRKRTPQIYSRSVAGFPFNVIYVKLNEEILITGEAGFSHSPKRQVAASGDVRRMVRLGGSRDDAWVRARLVLINGVPASGKTTLAQMWCQRHAARLPLCMDIDSVRFMLSGWRDALMEAGLAARDIAIAGIAVHLRSGRDVVVPQYLQRPEFIDRLETTASEYDALFVETALTIDAVTAESRFQERSTASEREDVQGALRGEMAAIVDEFDDFLASRSRVTRLPSGRDALSSLELAIARSEAGATAR